MPSYREGRQARMDEVKRDANPYVAGTPMHKFWDEGWGDTDTILRSQQSYR